MKGVILECVAAFAFAGLFIFDLCHQNVFTLGPLFSGIAMLLFASAAHRKWKEMRDDRKR
jgi:hypothetical protein